MEFPHYQPRLPELSRLCGVYSIKAELPFWWQDLVQELRKRGFEESLVELFRSTTSEEFRQGQFELLRHKECKAKLSEEARKLVSSPRIGRFLLEQLGASHPLTVSFNNRGAKLQEKEFVITADPWDIVTMSIRGKSWTSCQNFIDQGGQEIWTNLCDPGIVIVFVRTRGDKTEKDMDTRVILRHVWTYRKSPEETSKGGVVLDRFYGDASYVPAIQELISWLCQEYNLHLFEYAKYDSHHDLWEDEIGYQLTKGGEILTVRGPSVNFRGAPQPWMDNANWVEEKKHRGFHRLEAKVHLVSRR